MRFLTCVAGALLVLPCAAAITAALPAAMMGTWGWDAGSCAKADDDGHAIVRERSVDFAASSWQLEAIGEEAGTVRATATVHEEGEAETSTGTIELKVVGPDQLSISNGPGLTHIYLRCSPGETPHSG